MLPSNDTFFHLLAALLLLFFALDILQRTTTAARADHQIDPYKVLGLFAVAAGFIVMAACMGIAPFVS